MRSLLFALLPVLAAGAAAAAQQEPYIPPPLAVNPCTVKPNPVVPQAPGTSKPVHCPPPSAKPSAPAKDAPQGTSAADKFPYPGDATKDQGSSAADKFPYPGDAAADKAKEQPSSGSAGDKFPYPGDPAARDAGAGSSSSSSSSDDFDPTKVAPANVTRSKAPTDSKESAEARADEDLKVAKFYKSVGNEVAVYLRLKDAARLLPDTPDVHCDFAQAAQKMKKKDEAVTEYQTCLKLDPDGDGARAARKALAELK